MALQDHFGVHSSGGRRLFYVLRHYSISQGQLAFIRIDLFGKRWYRGLFAEQRRCEQGKIGYHQETENKTTVGLTIS